MRTEFAMFGDEKVVASLEEVSVTLTTHRVRYDASAFGDSELVSITLDSIASCGLTTTAHPILLGIGIAAIVAAFFPDEMGFRIGLVIAGVCCALAFFLTRRFCIRVSSNGGQEIRVSIAGKRRAAAAAFLDAVDRTKLDFIGSTR